MRRQFGVHHQPAVLYAHAQQPLGYAFEQPGRGAAVPGPRALALVDRFGAFYIAGRHVRLAFVSVRVFHGQQRRAQPRDGVVNLSCIAGQRLRPDGPGGRVGVNAAVLPYPGRVPRKITDIPVHYRIGRGEQKHAVIAVKPLFGDGHEFFRLFAFH